MIGNGWGDGIWLEAESACVEKAADGFNSVDVLALEENEAEGAMRVDVLALGDNDVDVDVGSVGGKIGSPL